MEENKNYKEVLSQEGIKNTKSRSAIWDVLEQADTPLTAEDIFMKLHDKHTSIWLSTVYRTLEILTEKKLLIKTNMLDSGKARYELNHKEHKHHVICVGCHKTISVGDCPFAEFEKSLKEKINFDITGHKLEVYGYCHECKLQK